MPERIWRGVPVPSSSVNFRSFSDFLTFSHVRTLTTVISTLQKSSKLTGGSGSGSGSAAGACAATCRASSSASSFCASMRGNSGAPTVTAASRGSRPNLHRLSQSAFSEAPMRRRISALVSGMNGCSRPPQMRMVSSRLYMTQARRGRLLSSRARIQGAVSSIYLLAREMTAKTSLSAFWKANCSICAA